MSSDEEDYIDAEEDDGDDNQNQRTMDLFSDATFSSPYECLKAANARHGVDFKGLVAEHRLDCYAFFKIINFIRTSGTRPQDVEDVVKSKQWNDDKYLKPAVEDDPILQMDIDDGCLMNDDGDKMPALEEDGGKKTAAAAADNSSTKNWDEMRRAVEKLRAEVRERDERMAEMAEDMNRMRTAARAMVEGAGGTIEDDNKLKSVSESRKETEDQSYAGSYAHFGIHHEMLSDKVRTESYRDAIQALPGVVAGKSVLDLGCGTGILSMFSAKAGAERVTGVDMSDIVHQAMDIVRENGHQDKITLIKGRLEDVRQLDGEKFDVIVSEWMGYFLLYEGMLDSVIDARKRYDNPMASRYMYSYDFFYNRYLSEGGHVLPNRCTMHLVAVSDPARYDDTVSFWSDVYGFTMTCMLEPSVVEASVEVVPADCVVSNAADIHMLDMECCEVADTEFETDFDLSVSRDCDVTAIAGYFDAFFDACGGVSFTTGPHGKTTHWRQTVFYLRQKMSVTAGQVVKGWIKVTRPREDVRSLRVHMTLDGVKQEYTLD